MNDLITFIPFIISIVSILISFLAMRKGNAKANYLEQDKQYADILKLAINDPDLRDYKVIAEKMRNGDKKFLTKYNIYAYLVWNVMETFYDLSSSYQGVFHKRHVLDNTWLPVILEENKIHYKWFKENQRLFKEEFQKYINQLNDVNVRTGEIEDLDIIYDSMKTLFPRNELKTKEKIAALMHKKKYILYISENTLLSGRESIIGFCFMYVIHEYKTAWMDYFAINTTYQDIGSGTFLFNNVMSNIGGGDMNLFLELEIPTSKEPQDLKNRRVKFYERQGVRLLNIDYKLPIGKEVTPMYLGFKPATTSTLLNYEILCEIIREIMNNIHDDESAMPNIRDEIIKQLEEDKTAIF